MRLEQEAKAEEENKYRNQCEARKQEIARLIALAEHSIRSLLADSEGKFLKYLTNVFKGYTNHPFEDLFGLCGFLQQSVQEASVPPVENAGNKKLLVVGSFQELKPSYVRILPLYEENIPETEHTEPFHMCDIIGPGNGSLRKIQILALAAKVANNFSDATPAEIQKIRLVHLLRTTDRSIGGDDYSEAVPVSLDQGFVEKLRDLIVSVESTFDFFLERFEPPSD